MLVVAQVIPELMIEMSAERLSFQIETDEPAEPWMLQYSTDGESWQDLLFLERGSNPLSPPCIPPKFVLHGLSARSKFLAAGMPPNTPVGMPVIGVEKLTFLTSSGGSLGASLLRLLS